MRIMVMLNPTNKKGTKSEYTNFRKFLISDGYLLLQPEIFMRITSNHKSTKKHIRKIWNCLPKSGVIRVFTMTEIQYSQILKYGDDNNEQEKIVGNNWFVSF